MGLLTRAALTAAAALLVSCAGAPTGPTPPPVPTTPIARITITDTVTGAVIGSMNVELARIPKQVEVTAPGYLPRNAALRALEQTVDLIPDAAPFSLAFYRQLVRNDHDAPGTMEPLRRLTQAPSIYLQTAGLTAADVAALEQAARMAVDEFSGHTLAVVTFEAGPELRPDRLGWITIEPVRDETASCGRAALGAPAGHVFLNIGRRECTRPLAHVLAHEIGHSLGLWHVADPRCLLSSARPLGHDGLPCAAERYHAAIAYHRSPGNRDIDDDSLTTSLTAGRMVVD